MSLAACFRLRLGFRLTACFGLIFLLACCEREKAAATSSARAERIISLSPATTDTIIELGAKDRLVGISQFDEGIEGIPAMGSGFTPQLEAMARAHPDWIVQTEIKGNDEASLQKIARMTELPWLTVEEVRSSILLLGSELGKEKEAQALARKFKTALAGPLPQGAPEVYMTWESEQPGRYYLKENSLHGALMRAAGARNFMRDLDQATPQLSTEELVRRNPPAILVLRPHAADSQKEAEIRASFAKLSALDAVAQKRIYVLSLPGILNMSPRILQLLPALRAQIATIQADLEPSPAPASP